MVAAIPALLSQVGSFALANAGGIASAISGVMGAMSMRNAGIAANNQAQAQAMQLDQQAKQERAVSHYEMARQRDEQKARASANQLALSTNGFAGDDASSVNLVSQVAGQETLEQLMTKALGDQRARNLENQATQTRVEGRQQRRAATLGAFTHLLGAATSWADRYGGSWRRDRGGGIGGAISTGQKPPIKKLQTT